MTKEELEKEAEEYADTVKCEWENDTYWVDCRDEVTDAFQAGAEFGYNKAKEDFVKQLKEVVETCNHWQEVAEKANEWHDLRKNPNDLPDTNRNVWVKRESEVECQIDNYYEDDKGWGIMFREGYCTDDVILWCELPVPSKE